MLLQPRNSDPISSPHSNPVNPCPLNARQKPYFRAIFPIFWLFFPIFWAGRFLCFSYLFPISGRRPETYSVAGQRGLNSSNIPSRKLAFSRAPEKIKKRIFLFSCGAPSRTVPKTQPLQVAFSLQERVDLRSSKRGFLGRKLPGKGGADRAKKRKKGGTKKGGLIKEVEDRRFTPSIKGVDCPKPLVL